MLKLKKIVFDNTGRDIIGPRDGVGAVIDLEKPPTPLVGWRVLVRGAAVFLVAPAKEGIEDVEIVELPRSTVRLRWSGAEAEVDKVAKYSSPPMGPSASTPTARLLDQIPAEQLGDP